MKRVDYNQPNTRARIEARRQRRRGGQDGSQVQPAPARAVRNWLASGHALSVVLLMAALATTAYCLFSPDFVVRQIDIRGAEILNADQIAEQVQATGDSVWSVNTGAIEAQLLTNPYIQRANAQIALPNQVIIQIVERKPEVRWETGTNRFMVDAQGLVLGVEDTAPLSDTLIIHDLSGQVLEPRQQVDTDALELARNLAMRLPGETGVVPQRLDWNRDTGIVVTTAEQRTIMFGTLEHLENKLNILATLQRDGTVYRMLDLRSAVPYYRTETPTPQP